MPDPQRVAVYTISSHRSFADALAAGLIARFGKDPLGLARGSKIAQPGGSPI